MKSVLQYLDKGMPGRKAGISKVLKVLDIVANYPIMIFVIVDKVRI